MNIWVSVNTDEFLTGYSLSEMPDMVGVDVENEPIDFSNWRLVNNQLIHDPENAPIVEEPISEVEKLKKENEKLKAELDATKIDLTNTQLGLAEVYEIVLGGEI